MAPETFHMGCLLQEMTDIEEASIAKKHQGTSSLLVYLHIVIVKFTYYRCAMEILKYIFTSTITD